MKIHRQTLIQHLNRVSCNGQVEGAVFTGAFATAALTEDHLLCVIAPGLPKVEALEEQIGVANISRLVKGLQILAGVGNEGVEVEVTVEDFRLVLHEGYRGSLHLLTAAPKTIGTAVEGETLKRLLEQCPTGKGIPLTKSLVDGIQDMFSLLKAEEVEIVVGKGKKAGKIVVGNANTADFHETPVKELVGKEEYSLLFGKHFVDALGTVTNFSEAQLLLAGPDSFVVVEDSGYRYLLSPRSRGAEG